MLTKQRQEIIVRLVEERGSIQVTEVRDLLGASESTIRRDITALDKEGKLVKVFGGAVAAGHRMTTHEYTVAQKADLNLEEKRVIAKYAASLVEPEDFIYLDAGTTTAQIMDFLEERNVTFVTNAVAHAQRLVTLGMKVILVGGELKGSTEAVVGSQAVQMLRNYHFTKGFFGSNGVTKNAGCTTPDPNEAIVKQTAMEQCRTSYVLCDSSKFGNVSSVTFAPFRGTVFVTEKAAEGYEDCENIIIIGADQAGHDMR